MKDCKYEELKGSINDQGLETYGCSRIHVVKDGGQNARIDFGMSGFVPEEPIVVKVLDGGNYLSPNSNLSNPVNEMTISGNGYFPIYLLNETFDIDISGKYIPTNAMIFTGNAAIQFDLKQLEYRDLIVLRMPYMYEVKGKITDLKRMIHLVDARIRATQITGDVLDLVSAWVENGRTAISTPIIFNGLLTNCTFNGRTIPNVINSCLTYENNGGKIAVYNDGSSDSSYANPTAVYLKGYAHDGSDFTPISGFTPTSSNVFYVD